MNTVNPINFAVLEEAANSVGWEVHEENESGGTTIYRFSRFSPSEEDLEYYARPERLLDDLWDNYRFFDVDEHVELWVGSRGQNGVPGTIRELLEDAEAIDKLLEQLFEAVRDASHIRI